MISHEQIKDLSKRIESLATYLNIEDKKISINNDEETASSPEFWNNHKTAEALMKVIRNNKKWVEEVII